MGSTIFIALAKTNDDHHAVARDFIETLAPPYQLMTSDYILDETVTRIRDSLGAEKAFYFCRKIMESRLYRIFFIDKKIFQAGLEWLKKYSDKDLSFTDCTSFVLMEKHRLTTAFTFDDDFKKVGFEMVPNFASRM